MRVPGEKREQVAGLSAFLLFALFAYSGFSKVVGFREFQRAILGSPLLTGLDPVFLAKVVVSSELTIAILLIWGRTRFVGMYLALFALVLMTIYLVKLTSLSVSAPCGCGGFINGLSDQAHIALNSIFVLVAIIGCLNVRAGTAYEANREC